ncbi:MAG: hypothetical protein RR139_02530 [Lachnospiraceae bacterium]
MCKKINSYLSMATVTFFIIHASLMCLLLSGVIPYRPQYSIAAFLLLILAVAHAALSIFIFFRVKEEKTGTEYWAQNKSTTVQRVMSILLLFMTVLHVKNGAELWVYQVVYIAIASVHIGVSLPRTLLTAGAVKSETAYKRFQLMSVVLGIAITVWSAISYGIFAL